jgi:hypothetical protein
MLALKLAVGKGSAKLPNCARIETVPCGPELERAHVQALSLRSPAGNSKQDDDNFRKLANQRPTFRYGSECDID